MEPGDTDQGNERHNLRNVIRVSMEQYRTTGLRWKENKQMH